MEKVVFSQASVFHLYRLGIAIAGITGKRYHLQNEDEVGKLLRASDRSADPKVVNEMAAFVSVTEPHIIAALEKQGLIRPDRYMTK